MGAAIYVPIAVSLLMWSAGPRLARWLPPATAVPLLTVTALTTALGTGFVLADAGFVVLAQLNPVAAVGHWSVASLRSGDSVPTFVGAAAGVAVTVLMITALRRVFCAVRELVAAAALCRRLPGTEGGLVVWRDDRPDAFALPGIRGRVVVSTAMLRALTADERAVLLAHESAHLRCHHQTYVQAVELAAAANPLLRPTAVAVQRATERWADEVAAAQVGDRQLAARALAGAALVRARSRARSGRRIGPSTALPAVDSGVPFRAQALLAPPPRHRRTLALGVASLILVTISGAVETAQDTETGFERAQASFGATP